MKAALVSALLGVVLAAPVAAQIAGSGQRTESDRHWYTVKEPERVPEPQPAPEPEARPVTRPDTAQPRRAVRTEIAPRRTVTILPVRTAPQPAGELAGGGDASLLRIVDVQAASRFGRASGVRIISGGDVRVVAPGEGIIGVQPAFIPSSSRMKLVRVGSRPDYVLTSYGVELAGTARRTEREVPGTIRVNP